MTNKRAIELINHIIDHTAAAKCTTETIQELLQMGFKPEELYNEFGFSKDDVRYATAPPPGKYILIFGPNTRQWWIYNTESDVYIDPPKAVLDKTAELPFDKQRKYIENIITTNPEWLYDEEAMYRDLEP